MSSDNSNDKPQSTYQRPAGMSSLFGQVEEVKTTMMDNFQLVQERQEKLEQLEDTTREMMTNAEDFSKNKVKGVKNKNKKK